MEQHQPRNEEAAQVANTFHVALALLGAYTYLQVRALWEDVVPTPTRFRSSAQSFASQALEAIASMRHIAQALFVAYVRLFRALHTGHTFQPILPDLSGPDIPATMEGDGVYPTAGSIRLNTLRADFYEQIERYVPEALDAAAEMPDKDVYDKVDTGHPVTNSDGGKYTPYDWTKFATDDIEILQDVIDKLEEILDATEDNSQGEITGIVNQKIDDFEDWLDKNLDGYTAEEGVIIWETEQDAYGEYIAGMADRNTQNGGRDAEYATGKHDKRVEGWVRVHHPEGDSVPCAFCALLISLGVYYKTEESASLQGSKFDDYHKGCHCRAEQVFSAAQYADPKYNQNREMAALWKSDWSQYIPKWTGTRDLKNFRRVIKRLKADRASAGTQERDAAA